MPKKTKAPSVRTSPGARRVTVGKPPKRSPEHESNEEILHRAMEKNGKITVNISFRVYDPDAKYYRSLHDASIVVDVATPAMVTRVRNRIGDLLKDPANWT